MYLRKRYGFIWFPILALSAEFKTGFLAVFPCAFQEIWNMLRVSVGRSATGGRAVLRLDGHPHAERAALEGAPAPREAPRRALVALRGEFWSKDGAVYPPFA